MVVGEDMQRSAVSAFANFIPYLQLPKQEMQSPSGPDQEKHSLLQIRDPPSPAPQWDVAMASAWWGMRSFAASPSVISDSCCTGDSCAREKHFVPPSLQSSFYTCTEVNMMYFERSTELYKHSWLSLKRCTEKRACKFYEKSCSILFNTVPQCRVQYLAQNRCSIAIYWLTAVPLESKAEM